MSRQEAKEHKRAQDSKDPESRSRVASSQNTLSFTECIIALRQITKPAETEIGAPIRMRCVSRRTQSKPVICLVAPGLASGNIPHSCCSLYCRGPPEYSLRCRVIQDGVWGSRVRSAIKSSRPGILAERRKAQLGEACDVIKTTLLQVSCTSSSCPRAHSEFCAASSSTCHHR